MAVLSKLDGIFIFLNTNTVASQVAVSGLELAKNQQ